MPKITKNIDERIKNMIEAKTSIIWINTKEYNRCISMLNRISKEVNKSLVLWDIKKNLYSLEEDIEDENPLDYVTEREEVILALKDFHMLIDDHTTWRSLANVVNTTASTGNVVIIISPIVKIPTEIAHYVSVISMDLPTVEDFKKILKNIDKSIKIATKDIDKIAKSGAGLTVYEFKNAINLSIAETGTIKAEYVFLTKKQIIEKSGCLKVYQSNENLKDLAGMDNMKEFTKLMVNSNNGRGILITGVPGVGKTEFAKRLGNETNRLTISLDFGELMGSYVGETEKKTSEAFKTIDAMSPSIVFIDEIEKGLSGTTQLSSDSVSKRQGGQFLKWLQDNNSNAYVVATANDISKLPCEFLRSGRWDAIFFVDMPSNKVKQDILEIHKKKYGIKEEFHIEKYNYTGAEIETLCRLAKNLNCSLLDATKFITPIAKSMSANIKELREFGASKAILADINNKNIDDMFNI